MRKLENLIGELLIRLISTLVAFMVCAYIPIHIYHETKCLELGYPQTKTTITLKGYCMGIQGDVNSKVVAL